MTGRRSWWGWGREDEALDDTALDGLGRLLAERFGREPPPPTRPPDPADVAPPEPRVEVPDALGHLASTVPVDRLRHGHGSSFRDVARAVHGDVPTPPDAVLRPRSAADVRDLLEWCTDAGVACVPFGGGTSVVGGVTPPDRPTVCLDLEHLTGLLELDTVSRLALVGGGTLGPRLEGDLRRHGLTFRHYPQSWEFSTVGGWIATRSAGHFATGPTHVDDLVAAVSAVTPAGIWTSRRLPASGAGPSPDRLLLGSEGILGVITGAWLRVRPRPTWRGSATLAFPDTSYGLRAVRAIVQAGLTPSNCRLLDPAEAALAGLAPPDGTETLLLLGVEGGDEPLEPDLQHAVALARDHGARVVEAARMRGDEEDADDGGPSEAAEGWRAAFLRAPYLRDGLVRLGAVAETFETATTWDRADDLVAELRETAQRAATEVCGSALVAVRTTHAYPDGIAPYLTVVAPGPPGAGGHRGADPAAGRALADAWDEVKAAVGEAIDAAGATITHHHAVGRDHRRWYDRQRPGPFAAALTAAKTAVDPAGVLNPGVLIDGPGPSGGSGPHGHRV